MTLKYRSFSPPPKDLTTLISNGSFERTPANVLKMKGKTERAKTKTDLAKRPTPKTTIMRGARATSGLAYSAVKKGSSVYPALRRQPINAPKGMPIRMAKPKPHKKALLLTARSPQRAPSITCSLKATMISEGLVKKNGFNGIRKVRASSQTTRKPKTEA